MRSIYANRNSKGDFLLNELERWADRGLSVCIASAFFTDAEVVERLLYKGCSVYMVVRLGFPTSPDAIERVRKHPNMNLRVYTSRTFHPKLYILGDEEALVGSANLTRSALMTNQEVVVHIDQHDGCLQDLVSIFDDYWAGASVPTDSELSTYRGLYRQFSKLDHEVGVLEQKVLGELGETSPANIDRSEARQDKRSAFVDGFRRIIRKPLQPSMSSGGSMRLVGIEKSLRRKFLCALRSTRSLAMCARLWQVATLGRVRRYVQRLSSGRCLSR